jgi:hypothetical protein
VTTSLASGLLGGSEMAAAVVARASCLLEGCDMPAAARASVLRLRSSVATSSTFYCATYAPSTTVQYHCTTTSNRWGTSGGPCLLNRKSVDATPQPWVMQAKRCEQSVRKLREHKTMTLECWQCKPTGPLNET